MRRHDHQMQRVVNALPALVGYIDTHHRYRFNNYAYELWYQLPYQQIKGRQVSDIVSLPVYRKMLPHLEQALLGETVSYELEMMKSSGQRVWASVSYIPDVQDNRVKGLFSLVHDISDRKATERLKDDFVSVVSHELRTPLTSVHGALKLIATGKLGQLDAQGKDLLSIALQNTERLTRLLNDVLDLERIESGHLRPLPVTCSVAKLIRQATDAMQAMANEHEITLVAPHLSQASAPAASSGPVSSPTPPLQVYADPDQIIQTLTNLLSNAIRFSPKGASVTVEAQPTNPNAGRYVRFLVKDTGRGIPSNKLSTIFERFHQVDASDARERDGTGLGLAICREIVQQHQGRIWVRSVHGVGSTFYFTLPMPPLDDPN